MKNKYGIEYALKPNLTAKEPTYYVFFQARDVEIMTTAFQEFSYQQLHKEDEKEKMSVKRQMEHIKEKQKSQKEEKPLEKQNQKQKEEKLL